MSAPAAGGPILLVDDDAPIRDLLHDIFAGSGYQCELASNGREALDTFAAAHPALTVTDVRMPVMDGLEFLRQARAMDPDAAVLVVTGVGDVQTAVQTLTGGAYDFLLKPVNPEQLLHAARRALEHRDLIIARREHQAELERHVADATQELNAALRRLDDTYRTTLEALGSAIDTRDVGTHAHCRRVRGYSLAIAQAHGIADPDRLRDIEHGVLLHDIGKIGIPDSILLKPGPLSPAEWKIMRRHPEIGRQLVERIPFLKGAVPIVYHHHERWDGTGYPQGLRGDAIPIEARIFAIADAFDAMTFDRPYSSAISFEAARAEIERCSGTHFDPDVVATFATVPLSLLDEIWRAGAEEGVPNDGLPAIPGLARTAPDPR